MSKSEAIKWVVVLVATALPFLLFMVGFIKGMLTHGL